MKDISYSYARTAQGDAISQSRWRASYSAEPTTIAFGSQHRHADEPEHDQHGENRENFLFAIGDGKGHDENYLGERSRSESQRFRVIEKLHERRFVADRRPWNVARDANEELI